MHLRSNHPLSIGKFPRHRPHRRQSLFGKVPLLPQSALDESICSANVRRPAQRLPSLSSSKNVSRLRAYLDKVPRFDQLSQFFPLTCHALVVVERCPPPPSKPRTIIYQKYLPPPEPQRQVVIQREACQPTACCPPPQPAPCRRLVREIIRQVPQPCAPPQPAVVCTQEQQQTIIQQPPQVRQQLVPVYATRRVS